MNEGRDFQKADLLILLANDAILNGKEGVARICVGDSVGDLHVRYRVERSAETVTLTLETPDYLFRDLDPSPKPLQRIRE